MKQRARASGVPSKYHFDGEIWTGIGKVIGLRLYAQQEAQLDAWIEAQPDPKPSKPEAIRRLLGEALSS
jgi:hypothetical protein